MSYIILFQINVFNSLPGALVSELDRVKGGEPVLLAVVNIFLLTKRFEELVEFVGPVSNPDSGRVFPVKIQGLQGNLLFFVEWTPKMGLNSLFSLLNRIDAFS